MAIFPFTNDVESLIDGMDAIPIDPEVPCSERFQEILQEHSGNPWGPNASARSKLATRLHFAGWSRQDLEAAGLKPKDVENFRQKFGLKVSKRIPRYRRTAPSDTTSADVFLSGMKARRDVLRIEIEERQVELERLEKAIGALEK